MKFCRLHIAQSWVVEGGLVNQYEIACALCTWKWIFLFLFFFSLVAPLFEFVYYSLLVILVCALHFWYGYLLFGP